MKKIIYLALFICIANQAKSQCAQSLNIDTSICTGSFSIIVDASVLDTNLCSDSVTIIFNATGTALAGDTNIYFHSAPQFVPFENWTSDTYTVGNWGMNDGVGRMTSLGNNTWSITVQPRTYYNYPLDSCLNGIWMVFRNFNGTLQAPASGAGNDFLYTVPNPPTSQNTGISGVKTTGTVTYLWSDNNTSSVRTFTTGVNYTVTATSVGGCSATGSVNIKTGHSSVSLGNNIIRCNPNVPVVLNAGSGFNTYIWLNNAPSADSTYTAVNPGCYWIEAIDAAGCTSSSTVQIENTEVNHLQIPDSLGTCPGGHVSVNASTNVNLLGDSIVIIYNATIGQTGLTGATKVYMHSGPQFTPSQGWQVNYTVGNYGQDDGVGEMTSLGNNLWRIAIDPYCYYKINPDTLLTGLWMIFRNADGSQTGKDPNGNNIYVPITNGIPASTFSGVVASRTARLPLTYAWSNSVAGPTNTFTVANTYTVTLSDNNGCSSTASVVVSLNGTLPINLGADTTICPGNSVVLTAPSGYAHYSWSNTDTLPSITVSSSATYSITATDSVGCQTTGSRKVTVSNSQVLIGNGQNIVKCTTAPFTLTATSGFATYQWLNAPVGTSATYVADAPGSYWVKAVDNAGCASYDTIGFHYSDVLGLSLPDTLNTCPGNLLSIDAGASIEQNGDSLVIIYNATDGQTGLIGASKVYMHSGPEFHPGAGWETAYTVGNWGQDDGLGEMDSMGNNLWRIVIEPHGYYHVNPDTGIDGIYMVFRNADGSQTGKDGNGENIFLSILPPVPVSQFNGVYGFRQAAGNITYNWSIPSTAPDIAVGTPGPYTVTVSDGNSCSKSATVQVTNNSNLSVSIGNDTVLCAGNSLTLSPGTGYTSFRWNTGGDTTSTLTVSSAGTYAVTVALGNCVASDSITVTIYSHAVSIGNDTVRCSSSPITLTASAGFLNYYWFGTGTSSRTYSAVKEGTYWVKATDASACASYDTITVTNSAVLGLDIPDSLNTCSGASVSVDALVNINANGDSLVITYDATKGVTGLTGASKVYMHSAPEFTPSQGWQNPYTVGNWGQDDGIGEMTSLGNNIWQITIDPVNYYHAPPDSVINGVFMVFRNADGTLEGKSAADSNILLQLPSGQPPFSIFNGVTGTRKAATTGLTYNWSNSVTTSFDHFDTSGTYSVTVSDQHGCSQSNSIKVVSVQSPVINLGSDTAVCSTGLFTLQADTGYASYVWNTGASTSYLYVTQSGTYSVTVSNTNGCNTADTISVALGQLPAINLGPDTSLCNNASINLEAGAGFSSYHWNTDSSTSYLSVTNPGTYSVTVINSAGCTNADTITVSAGQVPVVNLGPDTSLCNHATIVLEAGAGYILYHWNTGSSASSLTVSAPGSYSVTVSNSSGCTGTNTVEVDSCKNQVIVGCGSPTASFSVISIGAYNTVNFKNNSLITKILSFTWSFGDGTTANDTGNTVHTYATPGSYKVTLTIRDSCGGISSDSIFVDVNATGIPTISGLTLFSVYPNPSSGNFNIELTLQNQLEVFFLLIDPLGRVVWQKDQEANSGTTLLTVNGNSLSAGIYTLELISNSERTIKRLTLTN